jgi:hypothetical protein
VLPSTTTRFCIAYAVGSVSALLAYAFEVLSRIGSPYATPEAAAAYGLLGGVAGGLASLVLGWLWGPGAATRAGLLTLVGFLLLQLLYFANVKLLPGDPYYSPTSVAVDLLILVLVLVPPIWALRSVWVSRARERWGGTATVLGAVLLLTQCGLLVRAWPGRAARPPRTGEGPNLLLVVLDSARRDHLSLYGYSQPTSPALVALAREARVFEGASSASSWTVPSMMHVLRAGEDGSRGGGLAVRLAGKGYRTGCFTDNPHLGPVSGITRGFDHVERSVGRWRFFLRGTLLEEFVERADPGSDRGLVTRALHWVGEAQGPVFLYVHLMKSHTPYYGPPIDGRKRKGRRIEFPLTGMSMTADEAEDIVARYDGGIRTADAEAGRLLEAARGWGRPFVAVVIADHGESLGESGRWFHGGSLAPELLAVPLLVFGDGVRPGRVSSLVDSSSVPKTLLAAAGLACSACAGSDLRASEGDGFAEGGLPPNLAYRMNDRYTVVIDRTSGRRQLFDHVADPGETRDLAADQPETAAALAALAGAPPGEEGPDPDGVARLRALGYIGY